MKKFFKILFRFIFLLILAAVIGLGSQYHPDIPVEELKKTYANSESEFLQVEGMNIHYRDEGRGPVLVLLHGTSSSLHTWDAWAERLQMDFRVIRMDLPAYGLTGPHPDGKYSDGAYVNVLHKFLQKLEIDNFHIAGNSFGGNLAWHYAYEYPEEVQKMILIDASGFPQKGLPQIIALARNPLLQPLVEYITPKFLVVRNLEDAYKDPSRIGEATIDRYFKLTLREGNREAFVERANGVFSDQTGRLKALTQPTLIMWGEADTWIPLDHARKFNEALVNSQVITYSDAGHVPMEELPAPTAADARAFLLENEETFPELN